MRATSKKGPIVKARTTLAAALAATVALAAPEAKAAMPSAAANCWATPGNAYPWNVTCLAGPYMWKQVCTLQRSDLARRGHLVKPCRRMVWGGKSGYGAYYSGHTV